MKALRADTLTEVDLSGKGLGLAEALELRELLKASSKLTACNLLQNEFDFESAKMLAAIGTEKRIMLSGKILPDTFERAEADFSSQGLGPVDATLIASDALVSRVLNKIVLSYNKIKDEGAIALGEALKINKTLKELVLVERDIENMEIIVTRLTAELNAHELTAELKTGE